MKRGALHVVTTGIQKAEEITRIIHDIHPFVDFIHIREKQMPACEIHNLVLNLTENQIPLSKIIINDRVDVAMICGAKGVHLAYHSIPIEYVKKKFANLYLGCSVHSETEARHEKINNADYIMFGHVYQTKSKEGLPPKGLNQLKEVVNIVEIPVIAIGGIKPKNVREIISTGATGVAIMSGIFEASNPVKKAKEYYDNLFI